MKREGTATWKYSKTSEAGELFIGNERADRTPSLTWEALSATPFSLLASVQSGCLARAVAREMDENEMGPLSVVSHLAIELDLSGDEWQIEGMHVDVVATAEHEAPQGFDPILEQAKRRCPVLGALRVPVRMTSHLELPVRTR